jgi:uncharacterized membrane protein
MPKQNGQHRTARAPKQRARKCAGCTHYGVNRTRKGYGKQCLGAFGAIPAYEKIQFSEAGNCQTVESPVKSIVL